MEDGQEVSIAGIVRAPAAMRAPLSGEPCVVHVTHARVWSRLDWIGVLRGDFTVTETVHFTLETPQGEILIDAEHCTVDGPARQFGPPHHAAMHAFLAAHGFGGLAGSTFADHMIVAPDARVEIRGVAMRERAPASGEQGYRDEADRIKLVGYPQRPLAIVVA